MFRLASLTEHAHWKDVENKSQKRAKDEKATNLENLQQDMVPVLPQECDYFQKDNLAKK